MRDGSSSESLEVMLLDLHLGRLDADQAARLEEALASSPELSARSRALRELLGALDADAVPEAPVDLPDQVMARIEEQTQVLPFRQAASAVPAGTAHDLSASPVLSLRELIAIAACITLFVGIFVPGYFKAQRIAQINRCRQRMVSLHRGMMEYATDHDQQLMHAGFVPGGSWLPTRAPRVRRVSTTKPMFLLLKGGYVRDPRVFVCPASQGRPMTAQNYRQFTDFAERANVTYSTQYMNLPEARRVDDLNDRMVLVADLNPLFDSRAAANEINPYEDSGNSVTHGPGAGQNALYVGGHGRWFTEPTIGVNRDNIYRAGELVHYQGTEKPTSPTDNMLLP